MLSVEDRAAAILRAAEQEPDTQKASGRYRRSAPLQPGVRLWATSRLRQRQDLLGAQFHGAGRSRAETLAARFRAAGFEERNPETSKVTYAKPIPFAADGSIDVEEVRQVRSEVEAILGRRSETRSFREFMLASPWADVELELPERAVEPERQID